MVALDYKEMFYDEDYMEMALIGTRVTVSGPEVSPGLANAYANAYIRQKFRETEEIKSARGRGWETYMREKCILPRNRTYLDPNKRGILFTEPIVQNISGVLGKFREALHFVANPFAFDEINNPKLANYI